MTDCRHNEITCVRADADYRVYKCRLCGKVSTVTGSMKGKKPTWRGTRER